MSAIDAGSVCVKTTGRKAGEKVIVVELEKEKGFAVVVGENVKKKRCNLKHLMPLGKTVKVSKGIGEKEVANLLKE